MVKKIFKSFIPFLILLIGIFVFVLYLDSYAKRISIAPEIVSIVADTNSVSESIYQFELDEVDVSQPESKLESDTLYQKARKLYREREYGRSNKVFQQLSLIYKDAIIENYLGLLSLKDGNASQAQKHFQASVEMDSKYPTAFINLAVASSRLHQYKKAEAAYRKAIELHPSNPKSHYNLGLLYQGLEKWEMAAAELKESVDLSSGSKKAKSLCYLGISQLNMGDTIQARENFTKSVQYKPKYQLPRVFLALTTSDFDQREEELLKVYRLNQNSYYANFYLGKLYAELKQNSKAEYHFRKALEINPMDEEIIEELTAFLIQQERLDEAQLIIAGFSIHDTIPQTYFHEARLASKRGNIEDAVTLYDLAIEKSGFDYPKAALNKAVLYKQLKRTEEAIKSYNEAILMKEDYATAYYNLALLYSEIGNREQTIENYKKAIQYNPKSSKSWYNLASIYEEQQNFENAINAYQQAIKAEPGYLKALSSLGILYSKLEQYGQAIEIYSGLITKHPNYARGYYNMALAYNKSGQFKKAIDAYARVIEIDPGNIKAKKNIGVLYARTGNIELAIKTFQDAVDEDVQNPELRLNLALQLEKAALYGDAAYQYTKAIQLNEKYKKAYDNLIELYEKTGDETNANIVKYKWLKLNPEGKELYDMGKKLYDLKQYEFALNALRLANENGARENWTTYWTGMVYMDLKNYDEAISHFEKVTVIDNGHKFAFYRLGQTYELKGLPEKADFYYQKLLKLAPEFKIVHKKSENI